MFLPRYLLSRYSSFQFFSMQILITLCNFMGFPGGTGSKELACQYRSSKRHGVDPCVRKIAWRRAWQPTPVFLPGEFHGQSSPMGHKELGTTKAIWHTCNFIVYKYFFENKILLVTEYHYLWAPVSYRMFIY